MLIRAFDDHSAGFVNSPAAGGSTVLFRNSSEMLDGGSEFSYGTHSTPIVRDLSLALTLLEKAAASVLTCSGLSALTLVFMCCLRPGDRALVIDSVYEPLRGFCDGPLSARCLHWG
ncbi:MAG: PLP-dependent transferase [Candidatus Hodgkinia cicadicola]